MAQPRVSTTEDEEVAFERADDGALVVRLSGTWRLREGLPAMTDAERALGEGSVRAVRFEATALGPWDSSLVVFLTKLGELAERRKLSVDAEGLPPGLRRLLALAEAVPETKGARRSEERVSWIVRIGQQTLAARDAATEMLGFLGEMTIAVGRLFAGRARVRWSDLLLQVQLAGADALPIVTLISFLVGSIFAFVGAVQLEQFGAQIYVADLVGIAMVREMGAVMTGIVLAGRTGAAYAAQLGTMRVTQEIDALTTMGISPLEFLVLPRMIALSLMMPLLCLYSDFLGILGGAAVGIGMLDLPPIQYFRETGHAVTLTQLAGGIFKASVYGVLVAFAGCLRGLQSGKSASAVGDAATSAVVTGIVLIIVACGIFAVVFYVLGI